MLLLFPPHLERLELVSPVYSMARHNPPGRPSSPGKALIELLELFGRSKNPVAGDVVGDFVKTELQGERPKTVSGAVSLHRDHPGLLGMAVNYCIIRPCATSASGRVDSEAIRATKVSMECLLAAAPRGAQRKPTRRAKHAVPGAAYHCDIPADGCEPSHTSPALAHPMTAWARGARPPRPDST